jgi:hypothetical protein
MESLRIPFVAAVLLFAGGCGERNPAPTSPPPPVAEASQAAGNAGTSPAAPASAAGPAVAGPVQDIGPDGWLGRWNGPEGTSLMLARKDGGGYDLTITTLDGPTRYHGDAAGPNIVFERDGETQTLRAGIGKLTGLASLAEKSDCLVVRPGEGYCRD